MIYLLSNQYYDFSNKNIKKITISEAITKLSTLEWISFDTETTGLDRFKDKLLLMQLGNFDFQIVVDCITIDIQNFKSILEKSNLILQNAKFDIQFLYVNNIIPMGKIWDTMLAEQVLYNGYTIESSLQFLVKKYCFVELDKTERLHFINKRYSLTADSIIYGALDIKHLEFIKNNQIIKARKKEVLNAINLENEYVKSLAYIEYCGIYLDKEKWIKKYSFAKTDLITKEKELNNFIITTPNLDNYIDKQISMFTQYENNIPIFTETTINWASSTQVGKVLKDVGINIKTDNKTGESINEKILVKQSHISKLVPLYLEYKTIQKDFSTYGPKFLIHVNEKTNRIHPEFFQLTSTGRLSCTKPNLQNLPADKRTRGCFVAEKGNILIDGDYKAQEDIIFINNSKEKKMIKFYKLDNADGHSFVASLCFSKEIKNTPLEQIKKKFPKLRQLAKSAKFAIHYGGTGYTIAKNLNMTEEEGNEIEKAYLTAFPDIHKYLEKMKNLAKKNHYILMSPITGRKFWAENYENKSYYEKQEFHKLGCNYPIQSQSAELTKLGTIYFFNWILQNNLFNIVKIVNTIHDEVLVECPIKITDRVVKNLQKALEKGGKLYCPIVPLKADIEIANEWVH